ncbi:S-adenosyl methyltransferase [Frankia torreyi]|uniref:S-adenosyl methyltransferase n=1 Tax=Frankia torreyi TaxID=1856 RepID=A0A0D8BBU3_9ACTN|nr:MULTISPECIES: SAM-dependent methyltransferase [Frankia]KJE20847.1 S-adenosyl methyltransferase [Frankia torreyi]KQC36638.1 methyltransferase [Frankia sp. ACN1ag]KQM02709.1 S-adenosyl methyltransferase [Frankia sp. CpI1-P]
MATAEDEVSSASGAFSPAPRFISADLKMDIPHSARVYDYFLGGKDNFPADRAAAEQIISVFPDVQNTTQQNRAFMLRATRYLAGEAGVRQFLDIGTGIPTSPNLHEVAQGLAPDSRVVYVDNDPIVLVHARALLTSSPEGRTAYVDADFHDPARILASAEVRDTFDLDQPVVLSLIGMLHFIPDEGDPYGLVRTLTDALPSGSFLSLTHGTADFAPEEAESAAEIYRQQGIPTRLRSRDEVLRFFEGFDFVDPGLVNVLRWRADGTTDGLADAQVGTYGGVARKP